MVRKYNVQFFTAKVNGEEITLKCYTTSTRLGFCHTATVTTARYHHLSDTKQTYYNRTWERFDYESVLKRAIEKFPKEMREALYDQLIERKSAEEREKAETFLNNFESLYNGLNDENKKRMANLPPMQNEAEARAYMGFMGLLTLMQN